MSQGNHQNVPFVSKVVTILGLTGLMVVIFLSIFFSAGLLFTLFASILFAVILRGLGTKLSQKIKIPIANAVISVFLMLVIVLVVAIALLAPAVSTQIGEMRKALPEAVEQVSTQASKTDTGKLILEQVPTWDQVTELITSSGFLSSLAGVFSSTLGIGANLFLGTLLSVYLAIEPYTYIDGLLKLFPIKRRRRIKEVILNLGDILHSWLIGKATSMFFIGVATTIGLYLMGLPLAISLGLITALLTFIPNFGPILSAIPAVLLGLMISPSQAVNVILLYIGIQLVDNYYLTPTIERETVSIPPVLSIFFQMLLGVLIGGMGVVFATPILAVLMGLIKSFYIEDYLGDTAEN